MSGGHFNVYGSSVASELEGQWRDEEINELFFDFFGGGWSRRSRVFGKSYDEPPRECEFGPRGGGLFESLDFWLSGDTSEEEYRADVAAFKQKWLVKKTPKNRVAFYQSRFEEYAKEISEKFRAELGEV